MLVTRARDTRLRVSVSAKISSAGKPRVQGSDCGFVRSGVWADALGVYWWGPLHQPL